MKLYIRGLETVECLDVDTSATVADIKVNKDILLIIDVFIN